MAINVVAFPSLARSIDIEFERTGSTALTRATDKSIAVAADIAAGRGGIGRSMHDLAELGAAVEKLAADRPDEVDDDVIMPFGGGTIYWSLRSVVEMLRTLALSRYEQELNDNGKR